MSNSRTNLFEDIPIDLKRRSGYDLSHENILTQQCGTLTPILCNYLGPNETISLGIYSQIELPPLATNFFGRVDMAIEAFFVPMRQLWGGWKYFWTMPRFDPFSDSVYRPTTVPRLTVSTESSVFFAPNSLADYLGFKYVTSSLPFSENTEIQNALPFVAYHLIYDTHYRNHDLDKPLFVNPSNYSGETASPTHYLRTLPYITAVNALHTSPLLTSSMPFNDDSNIFTLRQRQWERDYFTTGTLYPQQNTTPAGVDFSAVVSGSSATGTITIPQLRNANILQRWVERNNLAGVLDYDNQIYGQYGVKPSDAHMNYPIFLGQCRFPIYSKTVSVTSSDASADTSRNPFNKFTGAKAGQSSSVGRGSLIQKFTTKEHGYLMVIASIVPHAYYGTGIRRELLLSTQADFPQPLLEGLGEQPIYTIELDTSLPSTSIFAYQQQYAWHKYMLDEVHGNLRDGENLSAFVLQRSFEGDLDDGITSDFVHIPTNFMDQVLAVNTSTSGFTAWCDYFFEYKKVAPYSQYVQPTLGDMKDTYKGHLPYRGDDIRG